LAILEKISGGARKWKDIKGGIRMRGMFSVLGKSL
jgi:hypothetical protein